MLHQNGNVVLAIPQRRQVHRDHVQSVEQILPELAVRDTFPQVHVGGRDDPHVDLEGVDAPQPHELPLLNHPQEFRLRFQRHVSDLVEKNRAAVRQFEQTLFHRDGACERAFDVAEQI